MALNLVPRMWNCFINPIECSTVTRYQLCNVLNACFEGVQESLNFLYGASSWSSPMYSLSPRKKLPSASLGPSERKMSMSLRTPGCGPEKKQGLPLWSTINWNFTQWYLYLPEYVARLMVFDLGLWMWTGKVSIAPIQPWPNTCWHGSRCHCIFVHWSLIECAIIFARNLSRTPNCRRSKELLDPLTRTRKWRRVGYVFK